MVLCIHMGYVMGWVSNSAGHNFGGVVVFVNNNNMGFII